LTLPESYVPTIKSVLDAKSDDDFFLQNQRMELSLQVISPKGFLPLP
jgi:hypothetical protein